MPKEFLTQYAPPTKYLSAPEGSICLVSKDDNLVDYYIQTGPEDSPQWIYMGLFLERVFEDKFRNEEFIKECLGIYLNKMETRPDRRSDSGRVVEVRK